MEFKVPVEYKSVRLDLFISKRLNNLGRRQIKSLIQQGHVHVNQRPLLKPGFLLRVDDLISIADEFTEPTSASRLMGADHKLQVLYEDEYLLAVFKPRAMHSVRLKPSDGLTLADSIAAYCPEALSASADEREAGLVQRLDYYTSGVILAAKSEELWQTLHQMLKCEQINKHYYALVEGHVPASVQFIDQPIKLTRGEKKVKLDLEGEMAETSIIYARPIESAALKSSLVKVAAKRARRHQIRAHLSYLSNPLIGDMLYDSNYNLEQLCLSGINLSEEGFYLHAESVEFKHPISGESLSIVAIDKTLTFLKGETRWEN